MTEYLIIGLATAIFGLAAGTAAAFGVTSGLMHLDFIFLPQSALFAAFGALAITLILGLIGTYKVLGDKAAPRLRAL